MSKFQIPVTKRMYVGGFVEVEAQTYLEAAEKAERQIATGQLRHEQAEWGNPSCEVGTFEVDGDEVDSHVFEDDEEWEENDLVLLAKEENPQERKNVKVKSTGLRLSNRKDQ